MILVTGGTGLVGSHLLYHLTLRNDRVRAVYRTRDGLPNVRKVFSYYTKKGDEYFSKIDWHQADITDVPSMIPVFEGVSQVYHCAALISFDPSDYRKMRKVNIHGTAIMVNLSIDVGVKKFCYVSSIAALGGNSKKLVSDEDNQWSNSEKNHVYGITKHGGEMEVWRASQEGVDVVIVNPGVILGSGFWNSGTGKVFTKVHKGFSYYTKGVTGFVGVKDVVSAMIQLMNSPLKNERFVLVAEHKSFSEILNTIADEFGKKHPSKAVAAWVTEAFWRWEWFLFKFTSRKPRISKYSARSLHSKTYYSSEKIKNALDFQFQKIRDVIKQVCNDY